MRRRRGAVLVMATMAMTGLMVITAIAVDLSRLFVLRTELQTAADAAALAAARQLNGTRSLAGPAAVDAARANRALDTLVDVDSVRFGVWRPESRTFVRTSGPIGADAAQVTVARTTTYLLARFFAPGPVRVRVSATAWGGAPAMRASCVAPWFILHHDFMEAFGKRHEDLLTHEDVRTLRDTATNKRWVKVRVRDGGKTGTNPRPVPGNFYGMILPSDRSGETPRRGSNEYKNNITRCNTMQRGWVAETEEAKTAALDTWPGLEKLCKQLSKPASGSGAHICYNESGGIGVPVTVSIFCTGPEHQGGRMWFEVEWMTGLMVTGGEKTKDGVEITGYLIPTEGTGEIRWDGEATGLVRTILVR
ncbi:MAG: pilus assembly protein TadG-related protein [Gemmatimonadaceae bacterium]